MSEQRIWIVSEGTYEPINIGAFSTEEAAEKFVEFWKANGHPETFVAEEFKLDWWTGVQKAVEGGAKFWRGKITYDGIGTVVEVEPDSFFEGSSVLLYLGRGGHRMVADVIARTEQEAMETVNKIRREMIESGRWERSQVK